MNKMGHFRLSNANFCVFQNIENASIFLTWENAEPIPKSDVKTSEIRKFLHLEGVFRAICLPSATYRTFLHQLHCTLKEQLPADPTAHVSNMFRLAQRFVTNAVTDGNKIRCVVK